jgi:hypothetical protein
MLKDLGTNHAWFVNALLLVVLAALVLLLVWGSMKLVGAEVKEWFRVLRTEREDAAARRVTVGALNWRGISALTVVGLITIAVLEFQKILDLLRHVLDQERLDVLTHSVNIANFFYILSFVVVASVLAIIAFEKIKRDGGRR